MKAILLMVGAISLTACVAETGSSSSSVTQVQSSVTVSSSSMVLAPSSSSSLTPASSSVLPSSSSVQSSSVPSLQDVSVSAGVYTLEAKGSGKVLEIANSNTTDGGNAVQWPDNGGAGQRWIVRDTGGGFYSLVNVNSGRALAPQNANAVDGANVAQYGYTEQAYQQWRIVESAGNYVRLLNRATGKALTIVGQQDGANAEQNSDAVLDTQQWSLRFLAGVDAPAEDKSTTNGAANHWMLSGNLGTHDPTLIEENGRWYLYQTGVGIYGKVSNDGLKWDPLPSVMPNPLNWWQTYVPANTNNDVWAPDVKHYGDRVWMYYSVSTFGEPTSAIGLLSATSLAANDWRDDGLVVKSSKSDNFNAIDPDLVTDEYGDPWLTFGSFWSGIKLTRLNPITMKPVGELHSIANYQPGIEAPSIVYRQGYYYLFVSRDKCCSGANSTYNIRYGRSQNITGPYLDKSGNNMLNGGGSLFDAGNDRWKGPGGQDIINTNIIVRHAYDSTNNGAAILLISNLNWDADGWPRF